MTSDLQALLAAIVANPADDVARLVYADCLEEYGNATRAAFIRLQIKSEQHHLDSNTRAVLEAQARTLFERHWREWWCEVCAAVGLPAEVIRSSNAQSGPPTFHFTDVRAYRFNIYCCRGFPEAVSFTSHETDAEFVRECLSRWSGISPLVSLTTWNDGPGWPEGPHLASVRALALMEYAPVLFHNAIGSPHLTRLESLTLRPDGTPYYTDELAAVLRSPWSERLKCLDVPLHSEECAELISKGPVPPLEELRLDLPWVDDDDDDFDHERWLGELARSPRLAGLKRLKVTAKVQPNDMAPLVQRPVWAGLRQLDLDFLSAARFDAIVSADLPELEELRLTGVRLTEQVVSDLVRSPLLKRLRHLAIRGGYEDGRALLPLVDVVDPAQIESFALAVPYFPARAANSLRAKFGDRVRFVPA